MREEIIKVYKFSELSKESKGKAREWYRRASEGDNFWSECVIDDAKAIGKLMGFDIDKVYYSGFWSQGDGACFEGSFLGSEFEAGGIQKFAPQDKELARIANEIEKIVNQFYSIYSKITHSGHYCHENCTRFETSIQDNTDNEIISPEAAEAEKNLIELSRDFMKYIYRNLEKEYEYQNSDEVVDETIESNDYEFTENGVIWN